MSRRPAARAASRPRTGAGKRLLLLAPLLVALVAGLAFAAGDQGSRPPGRDAGTEPRPSLGAATAPVVMVEYADFQCPFCGKFARDVKPELVERYVDSGTLRIEWRDFPYIGSESKRAAVAARAAGRQGKFWEYHDALFASQRGPNTGALGDDRLVEVARGLGLDVERFEADLRDDALAAAVRSDFEEGQRLGITGTPTFLVNGQVVVGAQPLEVFAQVIEDAAAATR